METEPLTISSLTEEEFVLITIQGILDSEHLPELKENAKKATIFIREESEKAKCKVLILIDLTKLSEIYDPRVILVLAEFEKNNQPYVQKTACFGANSKVKFAGEITTALSNRGNIVFVNTKEEACAVLKK